MAFYRLLQNVAVRDQTLPRGSMSRLSRLSERTKAILIERGAIAEVKPPPLEILPGWHRRSERLAKVKIVTATDYLEADPEVIMGCMRVSPETVARWAAEIESWLVGPPRPAG